MANDLLQSWSSTEGNWSYPGTVGQNYVSGEQYHALQRENVQLSKQLTIWQAKYQTLEWVSTFLEYFAV